MFTTEQEAARLALIQRTDTAAAAHHLAATKDSVLAPLTAGTNHIPGLQHITALPAHLTLPSPKWPLTPSVFLPKPFPYNLWG